jgi:hypothetical protein
MAGVEACHAGASAEGAGGDGPVTVPEGFAFPSSLPTSCQGDTYCEAEHVSGLCDGGVVYFACDLGVYTIQAVFCGLADLGGWTLASDSPNCAVDGCDAGADASHAVGTDAGTGTDAVGRATVEGGSADGSVGFDPSEVDAGDYPVDAAADGAHHPIIASP